MPGHLASYLQQALTAATPKGWQATPEAPLFDLDLATRLGFNPRCDLLLHHRRSDRRLWIEFEISRADPAANLMKFAVGHLHQPLGPGDTFVSMCSNHIAAGRRALVIGATSVLRRLSINAIHLDLLPDCDGPTIKQLNHASPAEVVTRQLPIAGELRRILDCSTTQSAGIHGELRLAPTCHLATETIRNWARDIVTEAGRTAWGNHRRCRYWALDPASGSIAPCKIAAYAIDHPGQWTLQALDIATYCQIEYEHPIFDGNRAWRHLHLGLGFHEGDDGHRQQAADWLQAHGLSNLATAGPYRVFTPGRLGPKGQT